MTGKGGVVAGDEAAGWLPEPWGPPNHDGALVWTVTLRGGVVLAYDGPGQLWPVAPHVEGEPAPPHPDVLRVMNAERDELQAEVDRLRAEVKPAGVPLELSKPWRSITDAFPDDGWVWGLTVDGRRGCALASTYRHWGLADICGVPLMAWAPYVPGEPPSDPGGDHWRLRSIPLEATR